MLKLRAIDGSARAQRALAAAAQAWRERGADAVLAAPPRQGMWLAIAAQTWSGWLQPSVWLAQVAPQWAGLALSAQTERLAAQWFAAAAQPLTLPLPELVAPLTVGALVSAEALPAHPLLRLMTPEGALWLAQVPAVLPSAQMDLPGLCWPLRWVMGESRVRYEALAQIAVGDLLLISEPLAQVRCHGITLAHFETYEEGLSMTWHTEDEQVEHELPTRTLAQLPVRLEFVLHQQMIPLDELKGLVAGGLLSLPAGAERRVEVRANGALLGRGELVQLDDSLGVALAAWLGAIDVE